MKFKSEEIKEALKQVKQERKMKKMQAKLEEKYGDPFLKSICGEDVSAKIDYELYKLSMRDAHTDMNLAFVFYMLALVVIIVGVWIEGIIPLSWLFVFLGTMGGINYRIETVYAKTYRDSIMNKYETLAYILKGLEEKKKSSCKKCTKKEGKCK